MSNGIGQQNSKLVKKLLLVVLAMFGFGFALVPLYNVFCSVTGINGKTSTKAVSYDNEGVDKKRMITMQFLAITAKGIPWRFETMMNEVEIHPGEVKLVKFYAKNESTHDIVGQAIPSVSPGEAANYLHKIECFCFSQQPLKAGQDAELALQFYLDRKLPKDIQTLTLSYTMYDVTNKVAS